MRTNGYASAPLAARTVAPIDHDDGSITLSDERVGKRHAGSPGSDDKIVSLDHARDPTSARSYLINV